MSISPPKLRPLLAILFSFPLFVKGARADTAVIQDNSFDFVNRLSGFDGNINDAGWWSVHANGNPDGAQQTYVSVENAVPAALPALAAGEFYVLNSATLSFVGNEFGAPGETAYVASCSVPFTAGRTVITYDGINTWPGGNEPGTSASFVGNAASAADAYLNRVATFTTGGTAVADVTPIIDDLLNASGNGRIFLTSTPAAGGSEAIVAVGDGTDWGTGSHWQIIGDNVFLTIDFEIRSNLDGDNDGIDDTYEDNNGLDKTDPNDAALDNDAVGGPDGLTNLQEYNLGTDPQDSDTDNDTISDGDEVGGVLNTAFGNAPTNPLNPDSDSDAIPDNEEVVAGVDGFVTNPNGADTEGDNLPDGYEVANGLDPLTDDSLVDNDSAGGPDGLNNLQEFTAGTDPQNSDTDGDAIGDGDELSGVQNTAFGNAPTNPLVGDSDGDTILDGEEVVAGVDGFVTDPNGADTDADGSSDSLEVALGNNPTDPSSGANLAVGKTLGFFDAGGLAVDPWGPLVLTNITDGNLTTMSHPEPQLTSGYYFELDLGAEVNVGHIFLAGRIDCCPERLEDPTVEILDAGFNVVSSQVVSGQIVNPVQVDLSAPPPLGRYVRVYNSSGADYGPQIAELEVYEGAGPTLFQIVDFLSDRSNGAVSLTWTSVPGSVYSVFATSDLSLPIGQWSEITDDFEATGGESTYVFFDTEAVGLLERFYKVRRNPPTP